jgi:hypothetical protein
MSADWRSYKPGTTVLENMDVGNDAILLILCTAINTGHFAVSDHTTMCIIIVAKCVCPKKLKLIGIMTVLFWA